MKKIAFICVMFVALIGLSVAALASEMDSLPDHPTGIPSVDATLDEPIIDPHHPIGNHDALGVDHEADMGAHGEADHGDHGETGGLPQLDPTWYMSQIFWLAVTFCLMYIPFRYKVLPDLSSVIERRREQIESDLRAARELKQKADDVHHSYQTIVKEARDKASALFIRAEMKVKGLEQEAFGEFYKSAAEKIAAAEKEVNAGKVKALSTINDLAADLAAEIAEKTSGIKASKSEAYTAIETLQKSEKKRAA